MSTAIKLRGDTTANWNINNPLLLDREIVVDTTLLRFKIGDGVTLYNSLPYMDAALATELGLKSPINNPAFTGTATLNGEPLGTNNLNGTNYLMVYGTGTPAENAAELQAAYEEAKKMPRYLGEFSVTSSDVVTIYKGQTYRLIEPDSYQIVTVDYTGLITSNPGIPATPEQAKSVRTTVIVAPGDYNFGTPFDVDSTGIDIVSLTGNVDVKLDGINVTADYIFLKGIDCGDVMFRVGNNIPALICDTCIGGDGSFSGDGGNASGKFIDCIGLDNSFGSDASGIFIRCTGGAGSFGGYGSLTGVLEYCKVISGNFNSTGGHLLYCIEGTSVVTSR